MHVHMYVSGCVRVHVCVCECVSVHVCVYVCVYVLACARACTYVSMFVCNDKFSELWNDVYYVESLEIGWIQTVVFSAWKG